MSSFDSLLNWRILCAVAKSGSLTQASEELDIDLKTCSRKFAALERELNRELLDRSTRPGKLTEAGEAILSEAEALVRAADKLRQSCDQRLLSEKVIRLSLPINGPRAELFSVLEKYHSIDPKVSFELLNDKDHLDLLDGNVDAALLPYEPNHSEIRTFDAGVSNNMLLCSPSYIARKGMPQKPADLAGHTVILRKARFYPHSTHIYHGDEACSLAEAEPLYVGDAMTCRTAALQGMGITVDVSVAFCRSEIEAGLLVPVLPGWHRSTWTMRVGIAASRIGEQRLVKFAQWYAEIQKEAYPKRWKPVYKMFGCTP